MCVQNYKARAEQFIRQQLLLAEEQAHRTTRLELTTKLRENMGAGWLWCYNAVTEYCKQNSLELLDGKAEEEAGRVRKMVTARYW
ncbi:MAG TPA: hypothetical protein VKU00_26865 [Chthonomonadaceae bacterium]|nr:hypothetical protein [Chthonomonadaceae bacterium]